MIDTSLYISFVLVASAVIVMPGPNVLVTIATSLAHGHIRGLQTVAGTLSAMAIQLYIAAMGTTLLAEFLAEVFQALKWLGAAYLLYLGVSRVRVAFRAQATDSPEIGTAAGSFGRGFIVGMTNPKTILFFGAFLPQFTAATLPIGPQIAVLSVSFLALALLFDGLYVLAASKVSEMAGTPVFRRWLDGCAGTLLIGSGVGLAIVRRS
ncbi:MAG: LysE family translocator [Gammaproteobacteria bacterium]|jgi:threonine/homoserine/homoserine lactone efflux protein